MTGAKSLSPASGDEVSAFVPPTDEEWQRAAEVGQRIVGNALAGKILRRIARGSTQALDLAVCFGALNGIVGAACAGSNPDARPLLEAHLVAIVRGVCRGLEAPVHADGTPFERDR